MSLDSNNSGEWWELPSVIDNITKLTDKTKNLVSGIEQSKETKIKIDLGEKWVWVISWAKLEIGNWNWILIKTKDWKFHLTTDWINTHEVNFLAINEAIPNFVVPRGPETEKTKPGDIIWNKDYRTVYFSLKDFKYYINTLWNFLPLKSIEI